MTSTEPASTYGSRIERQQALKTYQTPLGFYDLAIALSIRAALDAGVREQSVSGRPTSLRRPCRSMAWASSAPRTGVAAVSGARAFSLAIGRRPFAAALREEARKDPAAGLGVVRRLMTGATAGLAFDLGRTAFLMLHRSRRRASRAGWCAVAAAVGCLRKVCSSRRTSWPDREAAAE